MTASPASVVLVQLAAPSYSKPRATVSGGLRVHPVRALRSDAASPMGQAASAHSAAASAKVSK